MESSLSDTSGHLHTNCLNVHPLCHFATCLCTFDHVCMILHAFLMGLTHPCLHVFLRQFNHVQETKEETKGIRYNKMESNKHGCSIMFYHVLSRHQSLKIPLCQALGELRDLVPQSPPTVHLRTPWIQASRPVSAQNLSASSTEKSHSMQLRKWQFWSVILSDVSNPREHVRKDQSRL